MIKRPRTVLSLVVIITLILMYSAHNIKFERGLETYMSKESKVYINYKHYIKNFRAYERVYIFLKSDDVLSRDNLEYMLELEDALKGIEYVDEVISPASIVYKRLGYIPDDRRLVKDVLKDCDCLISDSFAIVTVTINTDNEEKLEEVARQIETITDFIPKPHGLSVQKTGSVFLWYQIKKEMSKSLGIMMAVSITLMVLILFFTFKTVVRRKSFAFLPLIISILSVIYVFGLMPILGIPMTELTHGALPILIGLSIDYAVQLQNRYEEERRKRGIEESIRIAIKRTGLAIFLSLITSILCFSSMAFCGVPGLGYFGIILSLGLAIAFVLTITFLPCILILFDKELKEMDRKMLLESLLRKFSIISVKKHRIIILLTILIIISGFYASSKIKMEIQHIKYVPQNLEAVVLFKELERVKGGQSTYIVVLKGELNDELLSRLDEFESYMNSRGLSCDSMLSVLKSRFGRIPSDEEIYEISDELKRYLSNDLIAIYISTRLEDYADYKRTYEEIEKDLKLFRFNRFYITGEPVLDMETGELMINGQMRMTVISYILIFVLLLIIYRSIKKAVIPILPITTVIGLMNLIMFLSGMKHTMMSITLNSIIIGLGIDYSIHVIERFYEERKKGDLKSSIRNTVERTGRAITISALTTAGGFFALMLSRFPIARTAGFLTTMAILLSLASALIIVPAFLTFFESFKSQSSHQVLV